MQSTTTEMNIKDSTDNATNWQKKNDHVISATYALVAFSAIVYVCALLSLTPTDLICAFINLFWY